MNYKIILPLVLLAFLQMPVDAQKKKKKNRKKDKTENVTDSVRLVTNIDSISYSLGVLFGSNLGKNGFDTLNTKLVEKGIEEMMTRRQPLINDQKANELLGKYVMDRRNAKSKLNLEAGNSFLEKNKTQSGVVELPSGLQYKVEKEGTGEKPTADDKVTVNYEGTLLDGTVFDSSYKRGEPLQITVNGVIPGWTEALQLMPVGSKWKLFIPANLAYGENPMPGGPIEPNSMLIFDVELISIDK